jgi:glycosyltransferase involved in cell wall biosynthesis
LRVAILTTDNREFFKDYGAPVPYFGTAPEALLQGFANLPQLDVHVISCVRKQMTSPEKLADNISFHQVIVPKFGWMTTGYQGCVRATRKLLIKLKPDIVHGQGTERECSMCAVFSGFPNVLTIHGNLRALAKKMQSRVGSYGWLAARLEGLCLRKTSGVFCNSTYTEEEVKPCARRTWKVPNAVRSEFFRPARNLGSGRNSTLLNIGVISSWKQQLKVLGVAEDLHARGLSCEVHFIGTAAPADPYAAEFLRRIQPLEKAGVAHYLGSKKAAELIDVLDNCGAVVHFPLEEAFGLVVAEALARNVKFFGARVGGIPDITEGAADAELFDPNDWTGLTDAITRWARAGFQRSQAPASQMAARYHPKLIAERHLAIYEELRK